MRLAEIKRRGVAAEQDRQFIVENLNDLLAWRDAAQNGFAERFVFDARDESLRDFKIDIGFEQREADLSQRGVDIRFADFSVATEIFEDLLQLVTELRKQIISSPKVMDSRPERHLHLLRFQTSSAFPLSCRPIWRSR